VNLFTQQAFSGYLGQHYKYHVLYCNLLHLIFKTIWQKKRAFLASTFVLKPAQAKGQRFSASRKDRFKLPLDNDRLLTLSCSGFVPNARPTTECKAFTSILYLVLTSADRSIVVDTMALISGCIKH